MYQVPFLLFSAMLFSILSLFSTDALAASEGLATLHEAPEETDEGLQCRFDPATHCMVLKAITLKGGQEVMCACGNLKGPCRSKEHQDLQGTDQVETRAGVFLTINARRRD
jgi:hypothetical protein